MYIKNLFRVFDQQNNGVIDFRQFLCGTSILLRGNLKQKTLLYIDTLQDKNKCITHEEFSKVTKKLVDLIHNLFEGDEQLLALEEVFKERANVFYN